MQRRASIRRNTGRR